MEWPTERPTTPILFAAKQIVDVVVQDRHDANRRRIEAARLQQQLDAGRLVVGGDQVAYLESLRKD